MACHCQITRPSRNVYYASLKSLVTSLRFYEFAVFKFPANLLMAVRRRFTWSFPALRIEVRRIAKLAQSRWFCKYSQMQL